MSFYIVILVFPWLFLALLLFWCSFPGVRLSLLLYSIQAQAEHLNLLDMSDSISKIPENEQVFTSLSPQMVMCLPEDLTEN